MTFEHAQRYLFSLYASSRRNRSGTAGRFGIGFWSVLRFEPKTIVVGSQPQRGNGWQVRFDGQLEAVTRQPTAMRRGTEVVLERQATGDVIEQLLTSSILRDAPWLGCRHRTDRPLEVRVNGRLVRAEPILAPPSMSFRRRGLRGVVGLGSEPGAEIFAHGFRVRNAATLDELLVESKSGPPTLASNPGGLSPRIIIDSRNLEVLMARGDAREDRALRRLVSVGHRELNRLVRLELDRHAGLSATRRFFERWRDVWSVSRLTKLIAMLVVAGALAAVAWRGASFWRSRPRAELRASETRASATPPPAVPYRDLGGLYRGPDVEGLDGTVPTVDLSYRPEDGEHFFAALWVTGLRTDGRPEVEDQRMIGPYQGAACVEDCLDVELRIDSPAGILRLPVATGHLVDPASVHLDGQKMPVGVLATGQAAVWLETPRVGRLRYRSGPGVSETLRTIGRWPDLPNHIADFVHEVEELPASIQAVEAARYVSRHIPYDISAETAVRHQEARERSVGLFDRAVTIGAGDCDVQNSLVVAMLDELELPSRLAVGWIGVDGQTHTGLHAWAEYRDADGRWRAVDASSAWFAERPAAGMAPPTPVGSRVTPVPRRGWTLPILISAMLVLAMVVLVVVRRPWRRRFHGGSGDDIVGLMRGAAVRPRSFEEIHALFVRRLLRTVSGKRISLARARELANEGRLACGSGKTKLASRAVRGGGTVLDLDQAESSAVADVLAAVNLDQWQEILDRADGDTVTAGVEGQLAAFGEPHSILVADNPGFESMVLDGTALGLGRCWTVLDEGGEVRRSIALLADRRPARAALVLADKVFHLTGVPKDIRNRCLGRLAMAAMLEANGGTS
jgi:hypothetical protein